MDSFALICIDLRKKTTLKTPEGKDTYFNYKSPFLEINALIGSSSVTNPFIFIEMKPTLHYITLRYP